MCAAQLLEFRKPLKPGKGVQQAFEIVRAHVTKLEYDRVLAPDIAHLASAIKNRDFEVLE
jgi:histidine ammonia-lyase